VHPWSGELVVDGAASEPVAILVNGPSSSGKSTLCRALHERLTDVAGDDATFASVAFDDVVLLISDTLFPISFVALAGGDITRLVSREPHDGRAAWEYVDESATAGGGDGHPRVRLVLRNDTRRLLSGIHRGWGEHLALGTHLIIDHFLQERDWSDEALDVIEKSGARIFSVGVYCSVQELERREASRADGELEGRPLGLARRSNELCHSHGLEYDVTVWTDQQTTEESVDAIVAALYSLQNGAPRPRENS
jgi:chloramphenicol 3-O phosphotransferase